jgi:hypothetical protein
MSRAERSTGISPIITNSVRAHVGPDRPTSTPISPDIGEQIEARLAPLMWKSILDTRSSSPKTWAQRRHP